MTSTIIELRQYTLHPGRRADLVHLFEREFVETQEAEGVDLIGQFLDLDDPDRFVWLRGFPDMDRRKGSLEHFCSGPVWAAHREAANATMIDSDDVLLLKPGGLDLAPGDRDTRPPDEAVLLVGVHDRPEGDPLALTQEALAGIGLAPLALLETEAAANTFPRLPVRTDGPWLVWLARVGSAAEANDALGRLTTRSPLGPQRQTLRLSPTPRSRLRP